MGIEPTAQIAFAPVDLKSKRGTSPPSASLTSRI